MGNDPLTTKLRKPYQDKKNQENQQKSEHENLLGVIACGGRTSLGREGPGEVRGCAGGYGGYNRGWGGYNRGWGGGLWGGNRANYYGGGAGWGGTASRGWGGGGGGTASASASSGTRTASGFGGTRRR